MNTILNIKTPKNNSHIYWEHAIKSAVGFVGTFILLFFGPMFLSGRRSYHGDSENNLTYIILTFLLEHTEVHIGASILVALIWNILIIRSNSKIHYVKRISYDEKHVQFELTNMYFKKTTAASIPIEDLEYELRTKNSDDGDKNTTLVFVNKKTKEIIGMIKPSHPNWSKQLREIRESLTELRNLGIEKKSVHTVRRTFTEFIFRK